MVCSMLSVTLLLVGCAGHVPLRQLTETPDDLVALQQCKADHPEADLTRYSYRGSDNAGRAVSGREADGLCEFGIRHDDLREL
jgi:hypothetical protein